MSPDMTSRHFYPDRIEPSVSRGGVKEGECGDCSVCSSTRSIVLQYTNSWQLFDTLFFYMDTSDLLYISMEWCMYIDWFWTIWSV